MDSVFFNLVKVIHDILIQWNKESIYFVFNIGLHVWGPHPSLHIHYALFQWSL